MASSKSITAAIVTVGTEITDGQIIDRNSTWISQRLQTLNITPLIHLSVPDDQTLMLTAFKNACDTSDLIFICGGLGPTVDDFTRNVIAEFVGRPLESNATFLKIIEQKITSRGLPLREGHYHQALFPQGAQGLENSYGVAPGFYVQWNGKKIWALPGPPKEIEAIWTHIHKQLESLPRPKSELTLKTWLCLGVAESEIAQITEDYFNNYTFKKQFGYRIELPYVELKLWYDRNDPSSLEAVQNFSQHIKKHYVASHLSEAHGPFIDWIQKYKKLEVIDQFTHGLFLQRLQQVLPVEVSKKISFGYVMQMDLNLPPVQEGTLRIEAQRRSNENITWIFKDINGQKELSVDIPPNRTSNYIQLYVLEVLFLNFSKV